MIMRRNWKSGGFTLIELLVVIINIGILMAVVGPEIYKAMQSDNTVKAAAKTLIADLKIAQNEAVRRGAGEMSTGGILVGKSVFAAFSPAAKTYALYDYGDLNGNNKRDADGTDEVKNFDTEKVLPVAVKFGASAAITTTACLNGAGGPPANGLSFAAFLGTTPCNGGKQCLEFNGYGFPVGSSPAGGWNIYLTNNNEDNKNTYAVNINPAGNFTLCRWTKGDTAWTIVR